MQPPRPALRPSTHQDHGVARDDPYTWLRDRDDPAVIAHLHEENRHTDAVTARLEPLRRRLFAEMLGRIQEADSSAPVLHGGWLYTTRTEQGRPYEIHCRRQPGGDDVVLCDENALAEGHDHFDLGAFVVAPDHRLAAIAIDTSGDEVYDLSFLDLATLQPLPDRLGSVSANVAWATDAQTVLYTTLDDTLRPHQIWRHALGTPRHEDVLVYEETDVTFMVAITRSRDSRWLQIVCQAAHTTEVMLLPADRPDTTPTVFCPRQVGHEYQVESQPEGFLVLTNHSADAQGHHDDRARTFALKYVATLGTPREAWSPLIPCRPEVTLEAVDAFETFYVVWERDDGLVHLRVRAPGVDLRVPMPEPAWTLGADSNPDPAARSYRFTYSSPSTPPTTLVWHLDQPRLEVLKETEVLGGFRPEDYEVRRGKALAPDGVEVPYTLVQRRDLGAGPHPCLLYGYGAYGIPVDPAFSSSRLSLLDRGVVVVLAHVRGGGDLGRAWYDAGRLSHKHRSFTDFIAIADALFEDVVTAPARLAIEGGSAGGLLVGATLNLAPERFRAAIADVPFVDALNAMLDPSLPLTTFEYGEWGDPSEPDAFRDILSWSPYENIGAHAYPDLLVTSGLNDPRVPFWQPTRWVARVRERTLGQPQILLKTWMGAGHAGQSGRYGWIEDLAFQRAWLLDRLGIPDEPVRKMPPPLATSASPG